MNGRDGGDDDGSSSDNGSGSSNDDGGGGANPNTMLMTCEAKIPKKTKTHTVWSEKKYDVLNTKPWMRMNKRFAVKSFSALCLLLYRDYLFVWKAHWWQRTMTMTTNEKWLRTSMTWSEIGEMQVTTIHSHIYFEFKHFFMLFIGSARHSHSTNKLLLIPMFDASCAALIHSLCLALSLSFHVCSTHACDRHARSS